MISGPDGSTANLGFVETLFFVDVLGCFAPATAATPMAISLKNVCLISLSLKEYPAFQQNREIQQLPGAYQE
jgi:hypothetical protein